MAHRFSSARAGRSMGAGIGLVLSLVVMLIVMAMYFGTFGGKSYMQNVAATRRQAMETVQDSTRQRRGAGMAKYKPRNNGWRRRAGERNGGRRCWTPGRSR